MRTVVVADPPPPEFEQFLERRHQSGTDRFDELWEGVLHMPPGPDFRHADLQAQVIRLIGPPAQARGMRTVANFNLGVADDYRIPDAGVHRAPQGLYSPSAAIVVEILSGGDATPEKLPFYAAHGVEEVIVVDPDERAVRWLALDAGEYRATERSAVLDLAVADVADRVDWPA